MSADTRGTSEQVRGVLSAYVSSITAESVLKTALRRAGRTPSDLDRVGLDDVVITELGRGLAFFLTTDAERRESMARLTALAQRRPRARGFAPIEIPIVEESGVVDARTRARAFARELGFDRADQAKIATSVSELARNIWSYARAGKVTLTALESPRVGMKIVAEDQGPGIANLAEILAGDYRSRTGMGLGILACKRLMDEFSITSTPGRGTTIVLAKRVP
ncbi:ATP-binding protein [Sandaracinus amylolyticus]|uniref:ATP-binding protein n=1 Tax=Sandaracinus amylolyticus TaxID=927083 RepID=UPI001F234A62|nr:ATP-binding protein [Sandaracinus amylolyticus]UJR84563.1 Hypothetical protein I5071_66420 [Sandaracinus amylolyticus]